ncbi:MAG: hypothetical protein ACUVYA_04170 [Planctomycetota bacterium]
MSRTSILALLVASIPLAAPRATPAAEGEDLFGLRDAIAEIASGLSPSSLFRAEAASGVSPAGLAPAAASTGLGILPGMSFLELSVGAGWQFGGELEYRPPAPWRKFEVNIEGGVMGRAAIDFFPAGVLGFGFYGQIADTALDIPSGRDILMWELGLSLKVRLPLGSLLVTPTGSLGYRRFDVSGSDIDSHGIGLNAGVDVRMKSGPLEIFVEPGFLYSPLGAVVDDSDVEVTHDPIFYVLGGIGLAF